VKAEKAKAQKILKLFLLSPYYDVFLWWT